MQKDTSELKNFEKPAEIYPEAGKNNRPEYRLFESQLESKNAEIENSDVGNYPKISLFGQAYYGYPSYDMFDDMFDDDWSFNWIIGIRFSWNLSHFYTKTDDKNRLESEKELIENSKEIFRFNNELDNERELSALSRYKKQLQMDDEIISLRQKVRASYETKLENGIIDTSRLLEEINKENRAKIDKTTHEIEMLKSLYDLKNVSNQ